MTFPTIEQFEAGDFDPAAFDHEAHIHVAWSYLQETDLLDAIARYRAALQSLTRRVGAESKYHETITWFYMVTIAERLESGASDWPAFRQANPELFERGAGWLRRFYSDERLWSAQARQTFVLPDRVPTSGTWRSTPQLRQNRARSNAMGPSNS
jgi:hypothetical protein